MINPALCTWSTLAIFQTQPQVLLTKLYALVIACRWRMEPVLVAVSEALQPPLPLTSGGGSHPTKQPPSSLGALHRPISLWRDLPMLPRVSSGQSEGRLCLTKQSPHAGKLLSKESTLLLLINCLLISCMDAFCIYCIRLYLALVKIISFWPLPPKM